MHNLLHGSPVYNTSALANSASPLDTSVLTLQLHGNRHHSPEWDFNAIDASFVNDPDDLLLTPPSDTESPAAPMNSVQAGIATSVTVKASPISKASSSSSLDPTASASASQSLKRKDPFQQVQELTATYTKSRLDSECLRAETKRQCLDTELNIQRLKNEEQERQRQHELQIINKQILLAQLQAGNTGMAFTQAPAGGGNYGQGNNQAW